jgi:hypothetical protein
MSDYAAKNQLDPYSILSNLLENQVYTPWFGYDSVMTIGIVRVDSGDGSIICCSEHLQLELVEL